MNIRMTERPAWWQWATVLSLDAPAVAVAWQAFFAQLWRAPLRAHHVLLLGAATWLVYAADRWMEGLEIDPARVQTQRHRFYQRWRWPLAGLILVVAAGAAGIAWASLSQPEWRAGLAIATPVAAYLVVGPLLRRTRPWRLPKEVLIAVLFCASTACFPLVAGGGITWRRALELGWFALLCFSNLALIARWEREVDVAHGQVSLALRHPAAARLIRLLPWLCSVAAAVVGGMHRLDPRLAGCLTVSGLLMGCLDQAEPRIGRQMARALVDATLLTPLLPLALGAR